MRPCERYRTTRTASSNHWAVVPDLRAEGAGLTHNRTLPLRRMVGCDAGQDPTRAEPMPFPHVCTCSPGDRSLSDQVPSRLRLHTGRARCLPQSCRCVKIRSDPGFWNSRWPGQQSAAELLQDSLPLAAPRAVSGSVAAHSSPRRAALPCVPYVSH